jgi:hypothetical protein
MREAKHAAGGAPAANNGKLPALDAIDWPGHPAARDFLCGGRSGMSNQMLHFLKYPSFDRLLP